MDYTAESLAALDRVGDELADTTVATLFERDEMGTFNDLMRGYQTSAQNLPEGLPEAARAYLEQTRLPPDWVDWEMMDKARLFLADNDVHISTALAFYAMPTVFAVPAAARLMSTTHGMQYPSRRMAATGQLVTYLTQPDAFEPGGRFMPAAQKVRLLHAAIRHHLVREGMWHEEPAVPISQQHLIGGQIAFAVGGLDALYRLGIHMTEEGVEAFFYAWRVVGATLGVDQAVSPPDMASGRAFWDQYLLRNLGPSAEGAELMRQLTAMYQAGVPGTLFDPLVPAMIRYLVGDTIADWLEVPRSPWDVGARGVAAFLNLLERIEDASPIAARLLDQAGRMTTSFQLTSLTKGRVMQYSIPDSLKSDYGVNTKTATARWTPPWVEEYRRAAGRR